MKSISFARVISISNPKESEAPGTPRNNQVYHVKEITSEDILDKIGDETLFGKKLFMFLPIALTPLSKNSFSRPSKLKLARA